MGGQREVGVDGASAEGQSLTAVVAEAQVSGAGPGKLGAEDEEWARRPQRAFWGRRLRRLLLAFRDPSVFVPGIIFLLVVLLCFLGPTIFDLPNPNVGNFEAHLLPIGSPGHLLGTNNLGNDMLSRLLHGGQVSLIVGFAATALGFFIGLVLGAVAGVAGGIIETIMMRFFDTLFAFPALIIALAIAAELGPGVSHTIWAISFFTIASFGRLARSQVVRIRNLDYVIAARAAGVSTWRMVFSHVIPNVMAPLLAYAMFSVAVAMIAEAGLSYLGLGIQIPKPSWGNLISSGDPFLASDPALVYMPAAALFITVISVNLLADSLRKRLAVDR